MSTPLSPAAPQVSPAGESARPVTHGTQHGYRLGCRCDECKAAKRQANAKYAEANRARVKRWREANPEKRREQSRRDVERNRAEHNRRGREWHQRNRELSREMSRRYWASEAGKVARRAANFARRTGRLRNLDAETRDALRIIASDPCAYCGGPATTVDHINPLSRGGLNDWSNMTAACRSCNSRKHTKPLLRFLLESPAPLYSGVRGLQERG